MFTTGENCNLFFEHSSFFRQVALINTWGYQHGSHGSPHGPCLQTPASIKAEQCHVISVSKLDLKGCQQTLALTSLIWQKSVVIKFKMVLMAVISTYRSRQTQHPLVIQDRLQSVKLLQFISLYFEARKVSWYSIDLKAMEQRD